jgi:uncharacterized membrane protein
MSDNKFLISGLIILSIWTGMIIIAPLMVSSKIDIFNYLGSVIYFFMDPVCHQLPQRSIYLASLPMPVCARCFSIYFSGVFVFLWQLFLKKRRPWALRTYLLLALPVMLEILGEKIGLYHNFFELRIISGILTGIIIFKLIIESFIGGKYNTHR